MDTKALSLEDGITLPGTSAKMPRLGFGVYQIPADQCAEACLAALEVGYRHIDSAQLYRNEAQVGDAIRRSGLERSDLFATTKVGQARGSPDATYANVLESVEKIGGKDGYVDLFLIHTPRFGAETRKELWLALERLRDEGRAKNIGVSNYSIEDLEEMREYASTWPPQVNQIELHPWCQQRQLAAYCQEHGIVLQAYSPLSQGENLGDATLGRIAEAHGRSPAQVLIRYGLQKGWVPLPKSSRPERIWENANVFDFALSDEDVAALDGLDGGVDGALFPKNASP